MFLRNFFSPERVEAIKKNIFDTLFPLYCLGCHKKHFWLCQTCESNLPRHTQQFCPLCSKAHTPYGQVCFSCKDSKASSLDGVFVATYYKDPLVKLLIQSYKYRFLSDLSVLLAQLLMGELKKYDIPLPDIIVPVPLHPRRLRFRGFNQAELLAKHIATSLMPGFPLSLRNSLLRTRYTTPQMKTISKEERVRNLKQAFSLAPKESEEILGKNIWLIDDVVTTGTTLEECAAILKKYGAKNIFGIVLAR